MANEESNGLEKQNLSLYADVSNAGRLDILPGAECSDKGAGSDTMGCKDVQREKY